MDNKVIVKVIANEHGNIGHLQLNKPEALNALDLDMIKTMFTQLMAWRNDSRIGAVFIDSSIDKAFSAGGDIVSLYKAMDTNDEGKLPDFLADFFTQEYRFDYCLHAYPKPVICWGNGIIMGGGLGVFLGASIKVMTETARVAMPEVSIGLFPDVGASYFFNKMPKGVGTFLGLCAANVNALDCVEIGLADYAIMNSKKEQVLQALASSKSFEQEYLQNLFAQLHATSKTDMPQGKLHGLYNELARFDECDNLGQVETLLLALNEQLPNNKVFKSALSSFLAASPISLHLVVQQLARAKHLNLAQCFEMELSMARRCCLGGEFKEGIRALVIDKDKQAAWQFSHYLDVTSRVVESHFTQFNLSPHPLATLIQEFGDYHG
ncbi:enoyl-CoA hydratase/isomerase family protein [Glaciecola sp. 2405UD65-10]|uniref:enoyl-CoA hydratase/isomerase family protein n=1 Tax=Glaciecola sp. 2405UD65-10 TaxID=3397244 RepID=UPI003B5C824D